MKKEACREDADLGGTMERITDHNRVRVREIRARSILNRSKVFDYCLNPYTGCQTNCRYCYARLFMRRYSGHTEPWGAFVDVKINAPELLEAQAARARKGTVWISSVCDPYQPLEATYRLTRRCLEILLRHGFPVNVQTKSVLALRDFDLFTRFEAIEVGFTVTTDDERIARLFEPGASPVGERLEALERLHAAGVRTFAFVGPILPGDPEKLVSRLEGKVDHLYIDRMNYAGSIHRFYEARGLGDALNDAFFSRMGDLLVLECRKRGIPCRVLF